MTESELRIIDAWLAQAIIVDYYTGAALRHARNGNTLHLSAEHDPSNGPDLTGFAALPLNMTCKGVRVDEDGKLVEVADEREHFYVCKTCGQAVDMREPEQVLHHEDKGHMPLQTQ